MPFSATRSDASSRRAFSIAPQAMMKTRLAIEKRFPASVPTFACSMVRTAGSGTSSRRFESRSTCTFPDDDSSSPYFSPKWVGLLCWISVSRAPRSSIPGIGFANAPHAPSP
ncbi:MAG: hypothetical protein ACYTGC_14945 [Planctomycetota bacterium]